MKLLTFQAASFSWKTHQQTLEVADPGGEGRLDAAVVAFLHAEQRDQQEDRRPKVFRHTLKHLKWLANKRELKNVVLHSFTHLGGENADPEFARGFMRELAERLETTGYRVEVTPFGWFSSWNLDVYGDSLAKVWKEI